MRRLTFILAFLLLPILGRAQTLISTTQIIQFVSQIPTPPNPPTNTALLYLNQSGNLACLTPTGGSCLSGGGSSGTVTSVTFTGDGVVESSTPSSAVTTSGTLTAVLATAAAGTVLGNSTGSVAAPSYTAAPLLGVDNATAGTIQLANGSAAAHTIFASGATTTNTIKGFTVIPTTGHLVTCTVSSTTCTLTDGGAVPSGASLLGGIGTISGNGTGYFSLLRGAPAVGPSATETNDQQIMSCGATSCTMSNLYVHLNATVGAGGSLVITVRKNASSTALTCPVATGTTTCNDTSDSFTWSPGDLLDIQEVGTSLGVAPITTWGFRVAAQ